MGNTPTKQEPVMHGGTVKVYANAPENSVGIAPIYANRTRDILDKIKGHLEPQEYNELWDTFARHDNLKAITLTERLKAKYHNNPMVASFLAMCEGYYVHKHFPSTPKQGGAKRKNKRASRRRSLRKRL